MWRRTIRALLVLLAVALPMTSCGFLGSSGSDVESTPKGVTAPQEDQLDVAYASASPAEKLDLYLPKRTGTPVPLVIAIHGGGWQEGDKHDIDGMIDPVRQAGYAVANINYRLSGEAVFPAALLDAKAAVRWLRAHATEYGLDASQFAAWGYSAGGNLADMIALTPTTGGAAKPRFNDPALGNPDVSSAVQAVVSLYGPTDLTNMDQQFAEDRHCPVQQESHDTPWSSESKYLGAKLSTVLPLARAASPIDYVSSATTIPPFYLAHGREDCTVPDRQSSTLAEALKAKGIRAELTIVPGFGHADTTFDRQQGPPALAFINSVFGRSGS